MPVYDHDMNWNEHLRNGIIHFWPCSVSVAETVNKMAMRPLLWLSAWQVQHSISHTYDCVESYVSRQTVSRRNVWRRHNIDKCLSKSLIADMTDQMTDRPLLQSDPAVWLADWPSRPSGNQKYDWMDKCPNMPTKWIEMNILESGQSFPKFLAFYYQTTTKPIDGGQPSKVSEKAASSTL